MRGGQLGWECLRNGPTKMLMYRWAGYEGACSWGGCTRVGKPLELVAASFLWPCARSQGRCDARRAAACQAACTAAPAPSPACFLSCRSGWCPRVSRADFTFEYKYMVGRGQLLTTGRPVGRFVEQTAERARRQRCPSTVCGQAGGETRQACINQQTVARNCPCQICRRWRTPACPAMAERLAAGAGCGHA